MARYPQSTLLMIGLTSLGILSGGLGLAFLSVVTIFRTAPGTAGESSQGAYVGVVLLMVLGAAIGAFTGLTIAIRRMTRDEFQRWHLLSWLSILLGIYLAEAILLSDALDRYGILAELFHTLPGEILLVISLATLSGIAGGFAAKLLPGSLRSLPLPLPLLVLVVKMTSYRL
jgi:hypothetical protein